MVWFWFGFFALVALLLVLDLGIIHREAKEQSLRTAAAWTAGWIALGLSFAGVVYLIYEHGWLGAHLRASVGGGRADGEDAAITYVSAYLLEQGLSVDNLFVISLAFHSFRMPVKYQHRVLFWGILGAVVFRLVLLSSGAYLAARFHWVFYIFGAYLVWQGGKRLRSSDDDDDDLGRSRAIRVLRRFVRIDDGDHGGKFSVVIDGRRALTTVAVCLIVVELTDIVFALDSIPAVLGVTTHPVVAVTSNLFAVLGLRSLYFVIAGLLGRLRHLEAGLAVVLAFVGLKMLVGFAIEVPVAVELAVIASILGGAVALSLRAPQPRSDS